MTAARAAEGLGGEELIDFLGLEFSECHREDESEGWGQEIQTTVERIG